jgi:uncharacterized membrane protein (UPF0182 family)
MDGSAKIYTPISLILAVVIAIPFYEQWESAILFFFGSSAGVTEPVFGNDISFYLFSTPSLFSFSTSFLLLPFYYFSWSAAYTG